MCYDMFFFFFKNNRGLIDIWQPYVCLKFLKYFKVIYNYDISVHMGQNVFGNHCPFTRPHGRAKMVLPVFIETIFQVKQLKRGVGQRQIDGISAVDTVV